VIPCLVSFRSTLRRTPKSHAIRPFRAASPTLPILCHPPVSVPPIFRRLFQVPYPVSPLFATLTKTPGVWGYSSHFGTARSVLPVSSCNRPASSPLNATLMRIPASVDSKWLTVALTLSDATLTKNTGGVCGPYLLTSLLRVCPIRPIAAQTLWCHNSQRRKISLPSGETTPLSPVSKTSERTSGTARSWSPTQVVPGSSVLRFKLGPISRVARLPHPARMHW